MDLSTLVKMSNTYGSNPAYVLAGHIRGCHGRIFIC